jgi:hypothetical protein
MEIGARVTGVKHSKSAVYKWDEALLKSSGILPKGSCFEGHLHIFY